MGKKLMNLGWKFNMHLGVYVFLYMYMVCLLQAVQLKYIQIDVVSVPVVTIEYPIG